MRNYYVNLLAAKIEYLLDRIRSSKIIKNFFIKLDSNAFIHFCLVFLVFVTVSEFLKFLTVYSYAYDSFVFYDISKSIFVENFEDFGRLSAARHFQQNLDNFRNSAFPLLFPFLMACFNKIFNAGLVAGTIINFFIAFGIYYLNLIFSKKLTNSLLCGVVINFALILNSSFYTELFTGFSIPLALILYQIIVYIFLFYEKINIKLSIMLGILAGLLLNCRFDTHLPVLAMMLLINLKNKKISIGETLTFIGIVLLFMLPWIIYSELFFGVLFASDNSRAVIATVPDHIRFYHATKIDTVFDNIGIWIKTYFTKKLPMIVVMFYINFIEKSYFMIPTVFFRNNFKKDKKLAYSYAITSLIFLALFGIITVSGFFWEVRYYIPIMWFIYLLVIFYFPSNKKYLQLLLVLIMLISSIKQLKYWYTYFTNYDLFKQHQMAVLSLDRFQDVVDNIKVADPTIAFIYTEHSISLFFPILTNIKSFILPDNINRDEKLFKYFIDDYKFDYIYIDTSNFKKLDFSRGVYEYDEEKCPKDTVSRTADGSKYFKCLANLNIKTGFYRNVQFNHKLFEEITKYFYVIPTNNKSLFRVIRK